MGNSGHSTASNGPQPNVTHLMTSLLYGLYGVPPLESSLKPSHVLDQSPRHILPTFGEGGVSLTGLGAARGLNMVTRVMVIWPSVSS